MRKRVNEKGVHIVCMLSVHVYYDASGAFSYNLRCWYSIQISLINRQHS